MPPRSSQGVNPVVFRLCPSHRYSHTTMKCQGRTLWELSILADKIFSSSIVLPAQEDILSDVIPSKRSISSDQVAAAITKQATSDDAEERGTKSASEEVDAIGIPKSSEQFPEAKQNSSEPKGKEKGSVKEVQAEKVSRQRARSLTTVSPNMVSRIRLSKSFIHTMVNSKAKEICVQESKVSTSGPSPGVA